MRFLVVGNIVKNRITHEGNDLKGKVAFGGSSYSAITANALGYDTHLLSRGNLEEEGFAEWVNYMQNQGISVHMQKDNCLVTSLHYFRNGERIEILSKSPKSKINYSSFKKALGFGNIDKIDIINFGPIFQEVDFKAVKRARKDCKFLSLDVQGLVRKEVGKKFVGCFWEDREKYLPYIDFLKVGKNEIPFVSKQKAYKKVCEELKSLGAKVVALTFGVDGSLVYDGEFFKILIFKTKTIDKTGSGDVYGTSFAIRFFETRDAFDSALFATAAASFVVEDFGPAGIAPREKVEERYEVLKKSLG